MEQTVAERPPAAANANGARYERCENCGAPLDLQQRYCVNCAARRPGVSSPAATYFGAVSRRSRQLRSAPPPRGSSARAAAVVFFALLPAAVGLGVIVGHSGNSGSSGDTADLLSALKGSGVGTATGDSALASDTGGGAITSDFSLDKGYAVEIGKLPIKGTDADAVKSAKDDASSKGAKDVGIINPADFTIKPDQGASDYILYSGEFKSKGDAQKALGDLKKDFKDAKVIQVSAVAAGGAGGSADQINKSGASDSSGGAGGAVIAHTSHGDIHSVKNLQPTQADQDIGARIAQQQAQQTGQNYVQNQANLPDVIAVGGDGSTPPPPTSPGD